VSRVEMLKCDFCERSGGAGVRLVRSGDALVWEGQA
jgi:hypothetical protein